MTIIQLEYAIAVNDLKSFSKASSACFVTQPTLSMQIQKLEDELGVMLFDRKKKPLKTTDIGEQIIEQARNVVNSSKGVQELVNQYKGKIAGELKIGIIPTVSPYLLPLFLPKLLEKLPDVELQIEEKTTEEILENLVTDHLDLGILATPTKNNRITEYPLYQEGMYFYVSPKHPFYQDKDIDIQAIQKKDLWLLNHGHCFRNQVLNLCNQIKKEDRNNFAFESGSLETIIKIIDAHNGLTVLPESALFTLSEQQRKHIRPVKPQKKQPGREISIVVSRTYLKQRLISSLSEIIISSLPPTLQQNKLNLLDIEESTTA